MRPGAAPLAYPYETNTDRPKNDRSSYTAEVFMADRGFSEHERTLARRAARLCVRFRNHQRRHKGDRTEYEGDTAESMLERTRLTQRRQVQVMCAAVRIATEGGEDFSKYAIESKGTYSDTEMLEALANLARELNRTPTSSDIRRDDASPSRRLYFRRFGSLQEAQRLAGLVPNPPHRPVAKNGNEEAA